MVLVTAAWRLDTRIGDQLQPELAGAEIGLRGTIASLPGVRSDFLQFNFRLTARQSELAGLPGLIRVRWYRANVVPEPGESWELKLRLHPPRGNVNFQGRDSERAFLAQGVGALGTVLEARKITNSDANSRGMHAVRANVRERIRALIPEGAPRALLLSLAIADRSELQGADWKLLRATGTGHLLAISGLHIGLAAVIGFWLCRMALVALPIPAVTARTSLATRGLAGFNACCAAAVVFAAGYGFLAGFPVSTQRALAMLVVAMLVIRARSVPGVTRALLIAGLVVVIANPFSVLAAGFWLSFTAVLALVLYFQPRSGKARWWASLTRAQIAVMALTLPMGAFWFQSGSWLAMPANLVAIPLVSLVTVPLVLAGIVLLLLPAASGVVLNLAYLSCEILLVYLRGVASLGAGDAMLTPHLTPVGLVFGLLGGLLLFLPRGLDARWLGACLLATVFLPRESGLEKGDYSIETLDVGQGLSVIVRTKRHELLYDTGPGNGSDWSLADGVIAPAIAADGRGPPDRIVVSHADLDHSGGLADLAARFPDVEVLANSQQSIGQIDTCTAGHAWTWDGVDFRVLHPTPYLPYLGNDSSCVISIDNGRSRSLLTGDISKAVEQRLEYAPERYEFVTVPHHGSNSSSHEHFIGAAQPLLAVVSAAYANRFGFPRQEVVSRYEEAGARLLSTIDCGAVRVVYPAKGEPSVETARMAGNYPWRWRSQSEDCMVTSGRGMYHLNRPKTKE